MTIGKDGANRSLVYGQIQGMPSADRGGVKISTSRDADQHEVLSQSMIVVKDPSFLTQAVPLQLL